MSKENSSLSTLTKGILKENPVLVLVLGTCPTLATTTSVINALGMGVAATIVLICSNVIISLLRKVIPNSVRIPCYIVVIAGFVSLVQMLVQAFVPDLYSALGVYLPLIVVNCIILGRAEMFASKNSVGASALDGIGMGLGFIVALLLMATVREVFGAGSFAGITIPVLSQFRIPILTQAPGGFFVFGAMMALVFKVTHGHAPVKKELGCAGCINAEACARIRKEG